MSTGDVDPRWRLTAPALMMSVPFVFIALVGVVVQVEDTGAAVGGGLILGAGMLVAVPVFLVGYVRVLQALWRHRPWWHWPSGWAVASLMTAISAGLATWGVYWFSVSRDDAGPLGLLLLASITVPAVAGLITVAISAFASHSAPPAEGLHATLLGDLGVREAGKHDPAPWE